MPDIDVVFIAPDPSAGHGLRSARRTIAFAPGEPLPRAGECVILGFDAEPSCWLVHDVAHVFEHGAHGIAIKLVAPRSDEGGG